MLVREKKKPSYQLQKHPFAGQIIFYQDVLGRTLLDSRAPHCWVKEVVFRMDRAKELCFSFSSSSSHWPEQNPFASALVHLDLLRGISRATSLPSCSQGPVGPEFLGLLPRTAFPLPLSMPVFRCHDLIIHLFLTHFIGDAEAARVLA